MPKYQHTLSKTVLQQNGFSLFEALLASLIMAISIVGVMQLHRLTLSNIVDDNQTDTAKNIMGQATDYVFARCSLKNLCTDPSLKNISTSIIPQGSPFKLSAKVNTDQNNTIDLILTWPNKGGDTRNNIARGSSCTALLKPADHCLHLKVVQ